MTSPPSADAALGKSPNRNPPDPLVQGSNRPAAFWWLVMLVLIVHSEAVAFSFNLVSPTLIPVATQFGTTQLGWMYTALTLVGAVLTPMITRLGDIHGKKPMILIITGIATFGAVLVAVANTYALVLLGRALEGVFLALAPLIYSLMRDIFPRKMLAFAVTVSASGVGVVTIAGPFIAGALVDNHGWQSVFWFLAIEQAVGLLLVWFIVPGSNFRARARLDVPGALLIGIGLALLLLGVGEGSTWGWLSLPTLASLLGGIALLVLWVIVENRVPEPLIQLSLLKQRSVATILAFGLLGQAALGLAATIIPIVVQTSPDAGMGYGFGVSGTGLAKFTATAGLATVVVGFILGLVIKQTGAKLPAILGSLIAIFGSLFIAFAHDTESQVIIGYALIGITQALIVSSLPALIIAAVPRDMQGISAGMSGTTQTLGASIGPTVGFAVLAAHVGTVAGGQPVYTESGIQYAYVAAAVFTVLALLVAFAIPRLTLPGNEDAAAVKTKG